MFFWEPLTWCQGHHWEQLLCWTQEDLIQPRKTCLVAVLNVRECLWRMFQVPFVNGGGFLTIGRPNALFTIMHFILLYPTWFLSKFCVQGKDEKPKYPWTFIQTQNVPHPKHTLHSTFATRCCLPESNRYFYVDWASVSILEEPPNTKVDEMGNHMANHTCITNNNNGGSVPLRQSTPGMIGKAKLNTIKITLTLVGVFLACWTPYYVICIW